jgi:hypothetical protein
LPGVRKGFRAQAALSGEDAGVIADVTLDEMIDDAREELRRRLHIYPALVRARKMRKEDAAIKIDRQRAILEALTQGGCL